MRFRFIWRPVLDELSRARRVCASQRRFIALVDTGRAAAAHAHTAADHHANPHGPATDTTTFGNVDAYRRATYRRWMANDSIGRLPPRDAG